tara:strand:- start:832 stop:2499 length:1668 start_codon:yes stop_codon:yes gene_type:complete
MKKYLFIFINIVFVFSLLAEDDPIVWTNYSSKWFFSEIKSENSSNIEFNKKDYLLINDNNTFEYYISNKNLFAKGLWEINENNFVFNYILPEDTTREYIIDYTEDKLILIENNVNYIFAKNPKTTKNKPILNKILRGILGLISLIFLAFIFSRDRKNINWSLVAKGLGIQIVFAFLILKIHFIYDFFYFIAQGFAKIILFISKGSEFLFGETLVNSTDFGAIFAFQVLPTIVFFSALTSLFYYWRVLPKIVYGFAWLMKKTLKLSGPESVAAAGNIFLGQTESPLLVKPYLDKMTKSEILCLMSGGMATIAGGVLAAFIQILGQELAVHLIMASVMSAPAAIVAAKILLPEKEAFDNTLEIDQKNTVTNELEAISQGTTDGIKLAVNVGAMLLVFMALMFMTNYILLKFGDWTSLNIWISENEWIQRNGGYKEISINMILGYIGAPIVWLMGVCKEDMFLVGQLLGEKTVLNEFIAYDSMLKMKNLGLFAEQKSIIIATYILCGFANFASIGIQIGGIGSLAPKRRGDLSRLGVLALIGGTLASLFTAVIVGMLI